MTSALFLAISFFAASAAAPRVSVLVSAKNANDASQLERAVEGRLASSPGIRLTPADDIADALAVEEVAAPGVDAATAVKADGLWTKAHQAYIEADYPAALRSLDELSPLVDRLGNAERVRAHELGAAVRVKLEDAPMARREALATIVLAGATPGDLEQYPPSVRRVFAEAQAETKNVTLTFEHAPARAEITVDDRPVTGSSVSLPAGEHRVRVKSRGFRRIEEDVDLSADKTLSLALAPALDAAADKLIASIVLLSPEKITADQKRSLNRLADRLDTDALVLAHRSSAETRAAIWWGAPSDTLLSLGVFKNGAEGDGALAERVGASLAAGRPGSAVAVVTTPQVVPTPAVIVVAPPRTPGKRDLVGGLVFATRARTLSGNGQSLSFRVVGVGPRLEYDVQRGSWVGEVEGSLINFGVQQTKVNAPDGSSVALKSGSQLGARLAGGYSFGGPGIRSERPWRVAFALQLQAEQFASSDVKDASGQPLGIAPGQLMIAPSGRVEALVPIDRLIVFASGNYIPVAQIQETPSHTTGDNQDNKGKTTGLLLQAGVTWAPIEKLSIGAALGYESRATHWRGLSQVATTLPMTDVNETINVETFQVCARFGF